MADVIARWAVNGWIAVVLMFGVGSAVCAESQTQKAARQNTDSLITQIDADTYTIGNIRLNKRSKQILMPGWVNMDRGLLEYLAVAPLGKTHEAVFVVDIQPMHLQLALLLLGLDFGGNLEYQGDSTLPRGDSVAVFVSWETERGDTVVHPASDCVADIRNKGVMPETRWVFTGSAVWEGKFMADMEGSIIATYADPVAILNNPLSGRVDDAVYGANEDVLPKPKTKILMTIKVP